MKKDSNQGTCFRMTLTQAKEKNSLATNGKKHLLDKKLIARIRFVQFTFYLFMLEREIRLFKPK